MAGKKIMTSLLMQIEANTAELQRDLNRANKKVDGFQKHVSKVGDAIKGAFAATAIIGATKAVFNFTQEIGKAANKVKNLTKLTGSELDKVTGRILGITNTFNTDFNKTLEAANALSQQMGLSFADALDKIEIGLAKSGPKGEEFLDQIREYPTFFAEAGASADDMIEIITKGFSKGIWNDKGIDAVKESILSLREQTQPTRDALNALGIDADEMQKSLKDGSMTLFEAMKQVSSQLQKVSENGDETGMILADVFKGAGEDAGVQFIKSLKDINGNLSEMEDNMTDAQKAQLNLSRASGKLNEVWSSLFGEASTGWQKLKTDAIEFATSVVSAFDGILPKQNSYIKQIETEKNEINKLIGEVIQANEGTKKRKDLIDELNKKYPSLLKNIDNEKVTNEDLTKALGDVNKEYIKRLALEKSKTKIDEQAELVAKSQRAQASLQGRINKKVADLAAQTGLVKQENESNLDFAHRLLEIEGDHTQEAVQLVKLINLRKEQASKSVDEEENYLKQLEDEFKELSKILNTQLEINKTLSDRPDPSNSGGSGGSGGGGNTNVKVSSNDYKDLEPVEIPGTIKVSESNSAEVLDIISSSFKSEEEKFEDTIENMIASSSEAAQAFAEDAQFAKNAFNEISETQKEKNAEFWQHFNAASNVALNASMQAVSLWGQAMRNQMNKELEQAGNNEKKKEQIRQKYAKKEKKLAIVQANIQIASSILQALGSLPPPYSYIMAGISAAMGAVQLSMIKSQNFASGGMIDSKGGMNLVNVNERGSEMITMPNGSMVHNNLQSRKMMKEGNKLQGEFRVRGEDLVLALNEAERRRANTI